MPAGTSRLEQRTLQAEQQFMRHCTFQPDLSKPGGTPPVIPTAAFTLHGQASMYPIHCVDPPPPLKELIVSIDNSGLPRLTW